MILPSVGSVLSNALSERAAPDEIECTINGEYSVTCRRDREHDEVFVPFSLVHKYFEVRDHI